MASSISLSPLQVSSEGRQHCWLPSFPIDTSLSQFSFSSTTSEPSYEPFWIERTYFCISTSTNQKIISYYNWLTSYFIPFLQELIFASLWPTYSVIRRHLKVTYTMPFFALIIKINMAYADKLRSNNALVLRVGTYGNVALATFILQAFQWLI